MKSFGIDCQGGKGMAGYAIDSCPTLAAISHGTPHAVCIMCDPLGSNSMKSSNPHSGFHKVSISPTLDTLNPSPTKNQGGIIIINLQSVADTMR